MGQQTNIAKQIQDFYNEMNKLIDNNIGYAEKFEENFNRISREIQKLESQQNKLADEAKYLEEVDIQRIYEENGGKEPITFAHDIITNEAMKETGLKESFADQFNNFRTGDNKSQVVFVNKDNHWMTVHLEKTDGGITYQVADSLEGEGADKRMNQIDKLLFDHGCTKIPFESEKQQNGYDCGTFAAKNAGLMKKAFDEMREKFVAQQKPQQTESNATQTNSYKPSNAWKVRQEIIKNKFVEKFNQLPKEERDIILNEAKKIQSYSLNTLFQSVVKAYKKHITNKEQQSSRLSSTLTVSSQRQLSASSSRSHISMREPLKLKMKASAIQNHNNKTSKGFNIV